MLVQCIIALVRECLDSLGPSDQLNQYIEFLNNFQVTVVPEMLLCIQYCESNINKEHVRESLAFKSLWTISL